jgi:hypothetical protein
MTSWRDTIIKDFTPQVARLTLVADPDGLLLEEGILHGIHERGFELIPFDDHIAFRYAYESRFRSRWDRGEYTDLVVVLRSALSDLKSLPFDLLRSGRPLSFNLGDIFQNLSYPVVATLDKSDLDSLYLAYHEHITETQGTNATKDFILRHVFGIAPEVIKTESDLLRLLLRRHYKRLRIPSGIDDRLIGILAKNQVFKEWPLKIIVPDREAFFAFLQERWLPFLKSITKDNEPKVAENDESFGLHFSGPALIPFDHDDVRGYVDNLFAEGFLNPVTLDKSPDEKNKWAFVGIQDATSRNVLQRIHSLTSLLEENLPVDNAPYQDWLQFAGKWAELRSIQFDDSSTDVIHKNSSQPPTLETNVKKAFSQWVLDRYSALYNQPPFPPVMVHHIPRFLSRIKQDESKRVALLVIDGLSLDQWYTVKNVLAGQLPEVTFREQNVFTWIPTITSVCRQAIFSGKAPMYFPNSIYSTEKEESFWRAYWGEHGVTSQHIGYYKGVNEQSQNEILAGISDSSIEVIGAVIDTVDKILHGMQLGTKGMHNQVRQWADFGFLSKLIRLLLKEGFSVALTSDHGNTESIGIGKPLEGSLAEIRGERVRIYSDSALRRRTKDRFPDAIEWPSHGLPDDFMPLLAPNGSSFTAANEKIIAHGGISMEELVVPFVKIERKNS